MKLLDGLCAETQGPVATSWTPALAGPDAALVQMELAAQAGEDLWSPLRLLRGPAAA